MKETVERLYRQLSVNIEAEPLGARVKGAQSALRSLTPTRAVGLAILSARAKENEQAAEWLRERMESAGETLPTNSKQELGILSAAILLESWSSATPAGTAAALALQSARFLDWKSRIPGLDDAADRYLQSAAVLTRKAAPQLGGGTLAQKPEERFPDGEGVDAERAREIYAEVKSLRTEVQAAVAALATADGALKEQSSILWWLFSGRFNDGTSWAEGREAGRPLHVAKDLFEMTAYLPGPTGSSNFMRRVLRDSEMDPNRKLTVAGASREIDQKLRNGLLATPVGETVLLLPILAGVHGLRSPDGARPGSLHRTALQLAEQLYRELLLQVLLRPPNTT